MAQVRINGESKTINSELNLSQLLASLTLSSPYFAIALNHSVVPKSEYSRIYLKEGDEIEIVHPVAGG